MRVVTILLFLVFNINLFAAVAEKDSLALVAFFDSTNGESWTTPWDLEQPVSTWSGITIDNDRVSRISLFSNNMNGNLPAEMSDLDSLEFLLLRQNDGLTKFPYHLASLQDLYYISLAQCALDTITSEIQNFVNLEILYINNNNLFGSMPAEIGQLSSLTHLNISQNDFSGAIPVEILNLSNLESFRAGGNDLTEMPDFSQLTLLNDLWIENNLLSGTLPDWVSDMTQMVSLNLSNNSFEGEFPASFANLQSLRTLYMDNNNFTGTIPAEIGTMDDVVFLQLYGCNFTGTIPAEIGDMASLQYLRLYNNQLEGEIPEHIFAPANLTTVELYNNNLTGTIPDSIATSLGLTDIKLHQNQLEGEIPDLKALHNLEEIWLGDNNFEGEIDWLNPKLENLERFYIQNNNFKGAIPEFFTKIASLRWMDISDNNFDYLPAFANHPLLSTLYMDGNQFTFEDITPQLNGNVSNITYGPQDTVLSPKEYVAPEGSALMLNMKIGGQKNRYNWYMNESLYLEGDTTGLLTLPDLYVYDEGEYYCEVINDSVPDLTIVTNQIYVSIGESNIDSLALVDLYNATNGASWNMKTNWLTSAPISDWFGVETDGDRLNIDLSANNLSGQIPETICNLMNARSLLLGENNLSGKIPTEISRLTFLNELQLNNNDFSGRVPQELALMDSLLIVALNDNHLMDLPDFSVFNKHFIAMAIENNALTFEDIESNLSTVDELSYAPQDSVGKSAEITVDEEGTFSLEVCVAGSANNYQWYLNDVAIEGAIDSIYSVEEAAGEDDGVYICKITSDLAPDLTIVSRPFEVTVNIVNSISADQNGIPVSYALKQNYPNPFNPSTRISYQLPQSAKVVLTVYDIMGREVKTLVNKYQQAGYYALDFDASSLSSGIYFYDIKSERFSKTLKMILMK